MRRLALFSCTDILPLSAGSASPQGADSVCSPAGRGSAALLKGRRARPAGVFIRRLPHVPGAEFIGKSANFILFSERNIQI